MHLTKKVSYKYVPCISYDGVTRRGGPNMINLGSFSIHLGLNNSSIRVFHDRSNLKKITIIVHIEAM